MKLVGELLPMPGFHIAEGAARPVPKIRPPRLALAHQLSEHRAPAEVILAQQHRCIGRLAAVVVRYYQFRKVPASPAGPAYSSHRIPILARIGGARPEVDIPAAGGDQGLAAERQVTAVERGAGHDTAGSEAHGGERLFSGQRVVVGVVAQHPAAGEAEAGIDKQLDRALEPVRRGIAVVVGKGDDAAVARR